MFREGSKYANHPRVTWFPADGSVAYVDYRSPLDSWFVGSNGGGRIMVIPPRVARGRGPGAQPLPQTFSTIDGGLDYVFSQLPADGTAGPTGSG